MGKNLLRKHFLKTKKGKANVFEDFLFLFNDLICNANKILLRDKNLLKLQCKVIYLLRDVDLYFLQIIPFFFHREVCLVSTNVIGDHCSFQGFVSFFGGESSLAVNIWIEDLVEHIAVLFFVLIRLFPRVARSCFLGFACTEAFWGNGCTPFFLGCYANSLHNVC